MSPRAQCRRCGTPADQFVADDLCGVCILEETLSPADPLHGETFGAYENLCEIGEGGIGVVYLAEQRFPVQREVALKALKPGFATRETIARFEAERQLLAQMNHPHIARVFDAGTSSAGRPYFVMEFVDGLPVTEYCDRESLTISERLAIFVEICRAVEHAHRRGVLHRDLKPSNILVAAYDGKAIPKIIDFGIAKFLERGLAGHSGQTGAGQILGTIEYMSPEQAGWSDAALDAAADVYSLGMVLFELLAGVAPYDAARLRQDDLARVLQVIREEEVPRMSVRFRQLEASVAERRASERKTTVAALARQLAGDLASIVAKAVAKDRAQRYQSAAALAEVLQLYLDGERIPRQLPRRIRKARTKWLAVGLVAAGLTAVVALVARRPIVHSARSIPTLTPVSDYPGHELDPALSPDGQRVAMAWNGDHANFDIYIKPARSGEPVRLTSDPAHDLSPAWSPDSRTIAFLRVSRRTKQVLTRSVDGGPERTVAELSSYAAEWEEDAAAIGRTPGPAWAPDGASLAVGDRKSKAGPDCIYVVSLKDGRKRKLTSPDAGTLGDSMPAFSPDGRQIAFVRAESRRGITDLYVAPLTGGTERQITFDRKTITGLAWTSDDRLVFSSNRAGGNMLWAISSRGGTPELIAIAGRRVVKVAASAGRIVYSESFRNSNIWRVDLLKRNNPAERLIATTRRNDSPKYSPNGKHIVFGSDRSGTYELWIAEADGARPRQITSFGGLPVGTPRWSPDGREIVFDAVKDGRSVIYVMSSEGGSARLFSEGDGDHMMPSWSSDGRSIYYAVRREGGSTLIWKKPVNGGPAFQVSHLAGGEAVETPDGDLVYFSDGRNGIWRVSPNGGGESLVPGLENVRHSRYFAVTRRGAYFLRDDSPPWVLQFYDFKTREISNVKRIENRILYGMPDLTVSPDDRWLLYAQLDGGGSDLQMLQQERDYTTSDR